MITVLIVGDIRLYRDGVASHLASFPQFLIVGTAAGHTGALRLVGERMPNVVLLDMAMPDSLETVRELTERAPNTRIVALAVPEDEGAVIACAEAGVASYVPRHGSLDDLVTAVEGAARDEGRVSPRIAASLFRRLSNLAAERGPGPRGAELTVREREIARLLDEGLTNKQIASRLCIEVATVKNHVHSILEKLGVQRRGEVRARLLSGRG
jgi:DNA-binding NarL/FixJ family response regulator